MLPPAYLDQLAVLVADSVSAPLSDARAICRGAYLELPLPSRLVTAPFSAVREGAVCSVLADATLPLGAQVDVLQLLCGDTTPLALIHLTPVAPAVAATAAATAFSSASAASTRREAVMQAAKQALWLRYRHARDALALSRSEEAALVDPCVELRADVAAAVSRLFTREAVPMPGVPLRVLVLPPAGKTGICLPASVASGAIADDAPPYLLRQGFVLTPAEPPTLTEAIEAVLRPVSSGTACSSSSGSTQLRGRVAFGGCVLQLPTDTNSLCLTPALVAELLSPDGFAYIAVDLRDQQKQQQPL